MSGVKHTPGPWGVEDPMDHCPTIVANPGAAVYDWKWVATCEWPDEDNHDFTAGEVKANARLIAAAPDLLEALQGLLGNAEIARLHLHATEEAVLVGSALFDTIQQARAAIQRATGDRPEKGEQE